MLQKLKRESLEQNCMQTNTEIITTAEEHCNADTLVQHWMAPAGHSPSPGHRQIRGTHMCRKHVSLLSLCNWKATSITLLLVTGAGKCSSYMSVVTIVHVLESGG